jgi:hypothetical protein
MNQNQIRPTIFNADSAQHTKFYQISRFYVLHAREAWHFIHMVLQFFLLLHEGSFHNVNCLIFSQFALESN